MKFVSKLHASLSKTTRQISALLASFTGADDDFFDELEEILILADLGAQASTETVELLRETVKNEGLRGVDEIKSALVDILTNRLSSANPVLKLETELSVILVIGVNGVGKTTTIGKLAYKYKNLGKKVLLCAEIRFGRRLASNWPSGPRAPARISCAVKTAQTRLPFYLTA